MINKSNIKNWKWRFNRRRVFSLPFIYAGYMPLLIESESGNVLAKLFEDKLTIERHYHFNGIKGLPSFYSTISASGVRDALIQISNKHPNIISRARADEAYLHQLKSESFNLAGIYYLAARIHSHLTK